MSQRTKLLLMFLPLLAFVAVWGAAVYDLRHPSSRSDNCMVTATGGDAERYAASGRTLYRHSDNPLHNISLRCDRLGALFLNDMQLAYTPVQAGQAALVSWRRYRFMPERWKVSVFTGHSDTVAKPPSER